MKNILKMLIAVSVVFTVMVIGFSTGNVFAEDRFGDSAVQWEVNGHWYDAVYTPNGINWSDAKNAAEAAGGYLATITSAEENAFIFSLISGNPDFWYVDAYNNGIGPWLGGYQLPDSPEPYGGWRWVTEEPFSYVNWAIGQPDNFQDMEDRLHFFGNKTATGETWNDIRGDTSSIRGYIIESDGPNSLTISPPSGDYVTTQGFDLTLIVKAPDLSVVGGSATLDGSDVTVPLATCVIPGTLVSGGLTFRCSGLTGGAFGTGTHILSVTLDLSDGSSVNDSVTWEVKENTEP